MLKKNNSLVRCSKHLMKKKQNKQLGIMQSSKKEQIGKRKSDNIKKNVNGELIIKKKYAKMKLKKKKEKSKSFENK